MTQQIPLTFVPSRCIKASFYIPENRLIFLQQTVLEQPIFKLHQIISIHYKSRIAIASRGL